MTRLLCMRLGAGQPGATLVTCILRDGSPRTQADMWSSMGTIASGDFDFLSTPAGGSGPFLAATHLQNTPSGGSGSAWVSGCTPGTPGCSTAPPLVPEPHSLGLLVVALAAFGLVRYHKQV